MMKKKAQEEMVGFVMIILIILVIGIVFLGFSLRKTTNTAQKQQEVSDMTWAILSYTTNCSISGAKDVWNLARECDRRPTQLCDNGIKTCESLNSTLYSILTTLIGNNVSLSNKYIHSYSFKISGRSNSSRIKVQQGNMSGNYFDYNTFIPTDINVSVRFYYS